MVQYTAHFVPCKARYDGPTKEFVANFHHDGKNDTALMKEGDESRANEDFNVRYIRGRKVMGKSFMDSDEYQPFLVKMSTNDDDSCAPNTTTIKPVAKISTLINYERDGNEQRLVEELNKLQEFLEIADVIQS